MDSSKVVPALQLSFRAALAAGLSFAIADLLRLQFPIYALIAAVIVTDLSPAQTQTLGLRRIAGTVLGTLLGAVLTIALPPGALTIGIGIFLSMAFSHMLRAPEAARVAGYLCAIVLLEHAANPWIYGFWRFIETVLGIAVAFLISLLPRLLGGKSPA